VARYNKKRARQLQHDVFRDKTMATFDRLGDRLEGRGRMILYALAGLAALAVLLGLYSWWSNRQLNEARAALGRAITIAETPVSPAPAPGATTPTFSTESERAQRAVEEFQKVEAKYGDPFKTQARYFKANNLLLLNRQQGISELEAVSKSDEDAIADWAKFALAQAREADGQYDAAAALYNELATDANSFVPAETVNLRLATVYEQQGKKAEAADLFFRIAETARKETDGEGQPAAPPSAAREAAEKLQKLDPARYAQLPPEPVRNLP